MVVVVSGPKARDDNDNDDNDDSAGDGDGDVDGDEGITPVAAAALFSPRFSSPAVVLQGTGPNCQTPPTSVATTIRLVVKDDDRGTVACTTER